MGVSGWSFCTKYELFQYLTSRKTVKNLTFSKPVVEMSTLPEIAEEGPFVDKFPFCLLVSWNGLEFQYLTSRKQ